MSRRRSALRRRYGRASDRTHVIIRGAYKTGGLDRGRVLWTATYVERGHTVARESSFRRGELEEWAHRMAHGVRIITVEPHGKAPPRITHAEFEWHVRAKRGRT